MMQRMHDWLVDAKPAHHLLKLGALSEWGSSENCLYIFTHNLDY